MKKLRNWQIRDLLKQEAYQVAYNEWPGGRLFCFTEKILLHNQQCIKEKLFTENLRKETEGGRIIVCKAIETYGDQRELQGKKEQAIETALKMIARGKLTLEEIAEDSGLTLEEVKELADKRSA